MAGMLDRIKLQGKYWDIEDILLVGLAQAVIFTRFNGIGLHS
jgi:hypothetical protein